MEQLHEHNQRTYENICRMYGEGIQRVAVVQPTGSGKSLLMAKLIEDNPNSRFFVLSTSHKINDQFKSKLDEETLKRIDFNIYCNMPNMNEETMKALQPDYIFLDEMHRALAKEWSKGINVLLEMYPNAKVLGLSATPIRYLDRCRNVVEELFNGNLACDMSLSQAILDGILPMARYVCGVYSYEKDTESLNKKIEKSSNSEEEKQELLKELKVLKENLDKGHGVSDIFKKYIVTGSEKFVVFLKDTTHLGVMKPVIEKWFTDAGFTVRMYEVHCKNADKDKEFQAFKADTEDGVIKACLSVNMVTEGIHGNIDGVIMLRETISPNMYFQMIGRAFSCGKKTIPLIFDLVANSQFISDVTDISFPNEIRGEVEKRKEECEKEDKEYEVGFDVDEFIVMDEFMDVVSGFRAIEGRLGGREWSEEEIEILKKWYPIEGTRVMDRLRGRTKSAIHSIVSKLGIKAPDIQWTELEIEILKRLYPQYGIKTKKFLPNRPIFSIRDKANELGLYVERISIFSAEEDEIIKQYYPLEGSDIYKRLNGKTKKQCRSRAKILNISFIDNGKWTEEEDDIIRKYYASDSEIVIKKLENRSKNQILQRASLLKVRRKSLDWTLDEDNTIRKYYQSEKAEIVKRLKGRSRDACVTRARILGVSEKGERIPWTEEDYKVLKEYYPIIGNEVSILLNRSKGACMAKASKLGIARNKNKYKYVHKCGNKYAVQFYVNGRIMRFGSFDSEEEAAKVAMQKAKEYGKAI